MSNRNTVCCGLLLLCGLSVSAAPVPRAERNGRKVVESRPAAAGRIHKDLAYAQVNGRPLQLDLYLPKRANGRPPLVVWIHGGGWRGGDKSRCPALLLLDHGYAVASVNYRLSTEAKWPAQIFDCKAAIRWLRAKADEYGYGAERIGVWGGSAGVHLVAMLGTSGDVAEVEGNEGITGVSSRVQAVCDWFGPTDLERLMADHAGLGARRRENNAVDFLFGAPIEKVPEKLRQANPITFVTRDDPPFLIMHGDKDPLVPAGQSELLDAALTRAGVPSKLRVLAGAGHGGPQFATPEARQTVVTFFERALRPATSGNVTTTTKPDR